MTIVKGIPYAGLCVILLAACIATGQEQAQPQAKPAAAGPGPRLELSETEWDFGTEWYGTPLSHQVTLANRGDAPLEIVKIRTSCGCTASKLDQRTIMPGESVPMTVTYDSKRIRQNINVTVTVNTNDPVRPTALFRIKGEVKPCFVLNPVGGISFGQIVRETAMTRKVEIQNVYTEKMFLELKPVEHPCYDVELKEIEPGMRYELTARTKPPLQSGNARHTVILTTNIDRVPQITVPVRSYIVPRVTITPKTIYVPKVYRKHSQKTLKVRSVADRPIEILSVTSEQPGVEAEVLPSREPSRPNFALQEIRVNLPPGKEIPDQGAWLVIKTDAEEPEFSEVKIRIHTGSYRPPVPAARGVPLPRRAEPTAPKAGTKPEPDEKEDQGAGSG